MEINFKNTSKIMNDINQMIYGVRPFKKEVEKLANDTDAQVEALDKLLKEPSVQETLKRLKEEESAEEHESTPSAGDEERHDEDELTPEELQEKSDEARETNL